MLFYLFVPFSTFKRQGPYGFFIDVYPVSAWNKIYAQETIVEEREGRRGELAGIGLAN